MNCGQEAKKVFPNSAIKTIVNELSNCSEAKLDRIMSILNVIKEIVSLDFKFNDIELVVNKQSTNNVNEIPNESIVNNTINKNEHIQVTNREGTNVTETAPKIKNRLKENKQNNIQISSLNKNKNKSIIKKVIIPSRVNKINGKNTIKKNG